MVSLLSRGVGALVKSLVGLSCTQTARCTSLPSALSAMQCTTQRWFSKDLAPDDFTNVPVKQPPKAPMSSYFRFMRERRSSLVKEHPDASVTTIAKMIGKEWRALPEDEKNVYLNAARIDILQYREIFRRYKESLNPFEVQALKDKRKQMMLKRKRIKQKRDNTLLGKPKRPRNPFNIFMTEHFGEVEGKSVPVRMEALKNMWQNLPDSKKQVYLQLSEDDKVRYYNEVRIWEDQMIEIGREDLVRYSQRSRLTKKNREFIERNFPENELEKKKAPKSAKGSKRPPWELEE